jgi:signal transduction histidine kinase
MRLADFIIENIQPILQEWENFAKTITPAAEGMDAEALRDHAEQMLRVIASDLRTSQTPGERIAKSHGEAPPAAEATPAETHAIVRQSSGFTVAQMISEYRALRTSVMVLWMPPENIDEVEEISDVIRFNEAIDQALAESVVTYSASVDAARNVFLGILGHDLRSPLGAITLSSEVLLGAADLPLKATKNISRIYTSVKRATKIVGDLLDFTRSQLGSGIPVRTAIDDLALACEGMVEEARAFHPDRQIDFESASSLIAEFDKSRIEQVISNFIDNAISHGEANTPITVILKDDGNQALLSVHNIGQPISDNDIARIFNPMVRNFKSNNVEYGSAAGLGLGLYIASAIVTAHKGVIDVYSTPYVGTTFLVKMPLFNNK